MALVGSPAPDHLARNPAPTAITRRAHFIGAISRRVRSDQCPRLSGRKDRGRSFRGSAGEARESGDLGARRLERGGRLRDPPACRGSRRALEAPDQPIGFGVELLDLAEAGAAGAAVPRWAWISFTSVISSSPSSSACRVPSSRCDMLTSFLRPIRFDQPAARPGQSRSDGALGQSQRRRDLLVIEPLGLEQERLAIPLVQRAEGGPDPRCVLVPTTSTSGPGAGRSCSFRSSSSRRPRVPSAGRPRAPG